MNLPFDYSRCAGKTDWLTNCLIKEPGHPESMNPVCNACRRREPGHPERQVYMAAALDELTGQCENRIAPEVA